jgi:hypothetical protein
MPFAENPQISGQHIPLNIIFAKEQPPKIAVASLGEIAEAQIALELT